MLVAVTALLSGNGCTPRESPPVTTALGLPDHVNEHVSLASADTWVAAAWSASEATGTNLYAAVSDDGGRTFSSPARVNSVERQANVNGEQPPRVALLSRQREPPAVVVVWTAKLPAGTGLLSARSVDGGRSFGASELVPGTEAPGNRGWESIAADADGRVYAAWLDHRDTVPQAGAAHAMHQHGSASPSQEDGVARAQHSQLFVGALDARATPRSVARGVCYCCKTAVLAVPGGVIYSAWRHVYSGNHRDIAFTVSRDGGRSFSEPARVSEDQWQIDGCPENGPSLAVDSARRVHVLWPTLVTEGGRETLRLFSASTADGKVFTPRSALPTEGAAYHAQLVAGQDGALWAAWDEVAAGATRRVRLARARTNVDGVAKFERVDLGPDDAGSYPALAATSQGVIVAWTTRDALESRIAVRSMQP
jgi:hypothetical protein